MKFLPCLALSATLLCGADFSTYRGFTFGADVKTVALQIGAKPKLTQQRPVLLQELEWSRKTEALAASPTDPVRGGVLSFADGKLYRIVVNYDRYKVEGMSTEDMTEAISLTYGPATHPDTEILHHDSFAETAKVLARWEDENVAVSLVRTWEGSSYALVLYSKVADAAAQRSIAEAARLDALDAPRRAKEAEQARLEKERTALEKSRSLNQPNFKP